MDISPFRSFTGGAGVPAPGVGKQESLTDLFSTIGDLNAQIRELQEERDGLLETARLRACDGDMKASRVKKRDSTDELVNPEPVKISHSEDKEASAARLLPKPRFLNIE